MVKRTIYVFLLIIFLFSLSPTDITAVCLTSAKKGVGGEATNSLLNQVGVSWWYNWQHWDERNFRTEAKFVPLVRACVGDSFHCPFYDRRTNQVRGLEKIRMGIRSGGKGQYWLVGNEPDRVDQDAIFVAETTARIYKQLADAIKAEDSTAKIIVGGWAQPERNEGFATSFKNNWPNLCEEIAGWHFHHYALGGEYKILDAWLANTDEFIDHLNLLCPGEELWLTEIGNLSAREERDLILLMNVVVPALENSPRVNRYAWFLMNSYPPGFPYLQGLTDNGQLTSLGQRYREFGTDPCESPTATPSVPHCQVCPSDKPTRNLGNANCDDFINRLDLSLWINHFSGADFNCDREVNRVDLSILISNL